MTEIICNVLPMPRDQTPEELLDGACCLMASCVTEAHRNGDTKTYNRLTARLASFAAVTNPVKWLYPTSR
jgi:hypothetical protein